MDVSQKFCKVNCKGLCRVAKGNHVAKLTSYGIHWVVAVTGDSPSDVHVTFGAIEASVDAQVGTLCALVSVVR